MHVLEAANEGEIAELKALRAAVDAARTVRENHEKAREELELDLHTAPRPKNSRVAFLVAVGESEPLPVQAASGRSRREVEEALAGAKFVIEDDKRAEEEATSRLRAQAIATVRACAERLAPTFLAAAKALEATWSTLAGAQAVVRSVTGSSDFDILDRDEWRKCYVPSSKQMPTLAEHGVSLGDHFNTSVLLGGEGYDRVESRAAAELQQSIQALLGAWPFGERGVFSDLGFAPAGAPPVHN
jgi:hypothetical protein